MMETSIKRDDTRQARIEAGAKVLAVSGVAGDLVETVWAGWSERDRQRFRDKAVAVLAAADAVGRERVSEAGIDEQALEGAARALLYEGGADDIDHAELIVRFVLTAYLTAAPPERHDAPGVTVGDFVMRMDCLSNAVMRQTTASLHARLGFAVDRDALRQKRDKAEQDLLDLFKAALTGQPDAGRDPDAADAGGE